MEENTFEKLKLREQELRLELVSHTTRAQGSVYMVNASLLPTKSTEDILRDLRSMKIEIHEKDKDAVDKPGITVLSPDDVETIDLSIDAERCHQLIDEISATQKKISELGKNLS